jgi:hypothetical protein
MFTISLETKNGETWYHCWGGLLSKDEKNAHVFANIGRARNVAKQKYSPHLRKIINWEIKQKSKIIAKEGK